MKRTIKRTKLQILYLLTLLLSAPIAASNNNQANLSSLDALRSNKQLQTIIEKNKDKTLVVTFFALWCYSCKESMSFFAKFLEDIKEQKATLVFISEDQNLDEAKALLGKKNSEVTLLHDQEQTLLKSLKVESVPFFLVIKDGQIKWQSHYPLHTQWEKVKRIF